MAKQKGKQKSQHVKRTPVPEPVLPKGKAGLTPGPAASPVFLFSDFRFQALLLAGIGLVFYFNSLFNQYALDDGVMIKENSYVQEGFKGLGKIFSKHTMAAYYEKMHASDQFAGGRYRPLSVASFAVEQSLFCINKGDQVEFTDDSGKIRNGKITGQDGFIFNVETADSTGTKSVKGLRGEVISTFWKETLSRHCTNVLLYLITIVFVLYFLRMQVFRRTPDLGFFCALIFAVHPIHTEVVCNIKSRDELMALLFLIMSMSFAFSNAEKKNRMQLFAGMICLFSALLSKEYAILMILLFPLFFYLVLMKNIRQSILLSLPYFITIALYSIVRFKVLPLSSSSDFHATEVLNNQYIAAKNFQESFSTKIYVLSRYLWMLIFPKTLCVDYSYNQIPFLTFASWKFWLSLFIHLGILAVTIRTFLQRHILSFFLIFYLAHLFLISNLYVEIGTTLGERLVYSPSFAFCVVAGWGIYELSGKIRNASVRPFALKAFALLLIMACGLRVVSRNTEWKSDTTLFLHDLSISPNSILVIGNAAKAYLDESEKPEFKSQSKELIQKAIVLLNRSLAIHEKNVNSYINLGLSYYKLGDYEKAKSYWDVAKAYYPSNPNLKSLYPILASGYLNRGFQLGSKQKYAEAIAEIRKAMAITPDNPEVWYNLGGAYFTIKDYPKAKEAWEKALKLKPDHKLALQGYSVLMNILSAGNQQAQK